MSKGRMDDGFCLFCRVSLLEVCLRWGIVGVLVVFRWRVRGGGLEITVSYNRED